MARRLIGLDVGTNAVTIAEVTPGTPPRLDMFAQVALPREAMREGEVDDEAAVSRRGRPFAHRSRVEEGGGACRHRQPPGRGAAGRDAADDARRVGQRVAVPGGRPDSDLARRRGARLRDPSAEPERGTTTARAAKAAKAASRRCTSCSRPRKKRWSCAWSAAVEAGGLQVAAVDLIPFALTRALARPLGVGGTGCREWRRRRARRNRRWAPKASCRSVVE